MNVGVAVVSLHLADSHSLKEKRGLLRSLQSRLRQRFNVAVAEVGAQDSHQMAVLGLCCLGNGSAHTEQELSSALRFIEAEVVGRAEVVDCHTEVLSGFSD